MGDPYAPKLDLMPDILPAGVHVVKHEDDSVQSSLSLSREKRPATPEDVEGFRRSYFNNRPGEKALPFRLRGTAPDDGRRFGIASKNSEKAETLIQGNSKSSIAEYFEDRKESVYASRRREPLGRAYIRGHSLPEQCGQKTFKFGIQSKTSEDAKSVLYPCGDEGAFFRKDDPEAKEIDERLCRKIDMHYDWSSTKMDPVNSRFGKPPEPVPSSAGELLKQDAPVLVGPRRRENYNVDNKHEVGRARPLPGPHRRLPQDHVFGVKSSDSEWGTKDCITGHYSIEERLPSTSLGRSVPVKGSSLDKIDISIPAGMPSIQRHKNPPAVRSVANSVNYGDGVSAQDLLYPPKYSFDGIEESDFTDGRSLEEIRSIFSSAGYVTTPADVDRIQMIIDSQFGGVCSIMAFQAAYNHLKGIC